MPTNTPPRRLIDALLDPAALWQLLREYFSFSRLRRVEPVNTRESLKQFLNTRASFVAQTSLYGYLRTRAGMRYPELFDDDVFVVSINIAKWQVWLACLSDLAVFAGGLILQRAGAGEDVVARLMQEVVEEILQETGVPAEAGSEFEQNAEQLRQRIRLCDWDRVTDDEHPFSHSPAALVKWAPVVDEFKQMDEDIVINSVRFRWQKVRSDLRGALDAGALLAARVSE